MIVSIHMYENGCGEQDGEEPPKAPAPAPRKPGAALIEPENSEVTVLTADTFDAFLDDNKFAVVEFYAPWCGECVINGAFVIHRSIGRWIGDWSLDRRLVAERRLVAG